jgi:hypothetical protein
MCLHVHNICKGLVAGEMLQIFKKYHFDNNDRLSDKSSRFYQV